MVAVSNTSSPLIQKREAADLVKAKSTTPESVKSVPPPEQKNIIETPDSFTLQNVDGFIVITLIRTCSKSFDQ